MSYDPTETAPTNTVEPFTTYHQAASQLGVSYAKLQRAALRGMFPVYKFGNGRPLVRVSEVVAAIEATRTGGAK